MSTTTYQRVGGNLLTPIRQDTSDEAREAAALRERVAVATAEAEATKASIRAAVLTVPAVIAANAEAKRLADALEQARREHLAATSDVERLVEAAAEAVRTGSGIEAAEKALEAGRTKAARLGNRVSVLTDAQAEASEAAAKLRDAEYRAECERRAPAAEKVFADARAAVEAMKAKHFAELHAAVQQLETADRVRATVSWTSRLPVTRGSFGG